MSASIAGIAQFKGEFKILDSNGKKSVLTLPFDQSINLDQLAHVIQTVAASQNDVEIGFASVARSKATYIDPHGVEIQVKFEANMNVAHKIQYPSVILGEITELYVTTGADAACIEVVVGGPAS